MNPGEIFHIPDEFISIIHLKSKRTWKIIHRCIYSQFVYDIIFLKEIITAIYIKLPQVHFIVNMSEMLKIVYNRRYDFQTCYTFIITRVFELYIFGKCPTIVIKLLHHQFIFTKDSLVFEILV